MRCETCAGSGKLRLSYPVPCRLVFRGYYLGYDVFPCPACDGSGITSCCDGAVGGPGDVPNGCPTAATEGGDG